MSELEQGVELREIFGPDNPDGSYYHVARDDRIDLESKAVVRITVTMEAGQMAGVPWAKVVRADGTVELVNLAIVTERGSYQTPRGVGRAPCDGCALYERCMVEPIACRVFERYVNEGTVRERQFLDRPERGVYAKIFTDAYSSWRAPFLPPWLPPA